MAASDARAVPKYGVAYRATFPIFDADGDLVTGAAGLDSEVSLDAAAFADCVNEASEIGTSGIYRLDLTAEEMVADTVVVLIKTSTTGAKTTPLVLYPERAARVEPRGFIYGPKKNAAFSFWITLSASKGGIKTTPTIAAGDFKISKDGGAIANPDTLPAETPAGSGLVKVVLSATEMNADQIILRWIDAAGGEWEDGMVCIVTRAVTVDELVRSTTPANTLDVAATGEAGCDLNNAKLPDTLTLFTNVYIETVAAVESVTAIGAGAISAASFATGALTGDAVAASFTQAIFDKATSLLTTAGSIGKLLVDNLTSLIASMGAWLGTGAETVKGGIEALANSAATKPVGFGSAFDGAKHSLEKIGAQTQGIGYSSGNSVIFRLNAIQNLVTAGLVDVYTADVQYTIDGTGSRDEYTVTFLKNGVVQTTGVTNAKLQVVKRVDGTDLIALSALTQVGSTAGWKYDATSGERQAAGEAVLVNVQADIGGSTRSFSRLCGRDSSA